ncbi:S-adenosyl-L-methionine-dependent methyltransferase, partial [Meira miltonrushii]
MSDIYIQAALVLDGTHAQTGSLKGLVMERAKASKTDAKRLLALSANTLSYSRALEIVLKQSEFLKLEKRAITTATAGKGCTPQSLALVVAHDLLLTKRGRIATSPAWPPHAAFVRHSARLKAELVKLQVQEGKTSVQELRTGEAIKKRAERIPRWIRVNERLTTVEKVMEQLQAEGWKEVQKGKELLLKVKTFSRSRHIPAVLATHAAHTSALIGHPLYKKGHLMLQDLASCFPAEILLGSSIADNATAIHALDATSAPGNKTSHLSAILSKAAKGSDVVAFEHSKQRFETLQQQLRRAGALDTNKPGFVKPVFGDFTKTQPEKYSKVTHMLLDPSCSGSGILGRLDYLTRDQDEVDNAEGVEGDASTQQQERLKGLAAFQSSMIDHAMHFPSLQRLVYSTCSIHHEENEEVVIKALNSDIAKKRGWRLAQRREVVSSWPTRGITEHCKGDQVLANGMIRCVPGGEENADAAQSNTGSESTEPHMEATNGFFVTCFVRSVEQKGDNVKEEEKNTVSAPQSNTLKNRKRKQRAKEK